MVPVLPATALLMKSTFAVRSSPPPASCMFMVMVRPLVRAISWMRGRSDWGRARLIFTGWISLMVTSGVAEAVALEAAITMLPGWIRMGPVLPVTGARMAVNSRFSRAASAVALASR